MTMEELSQDLDQLANDVATLRDRVQEDAAILRERCRVLKERVQDFGQERVVESLRR